MDKFCRECGNKINDYAKFCSNCGAKVESTATNLKSNAQSDTAHKLPTGMTATPDGKIWWSYIEKKKEVMCYFDDQKIAVMNEIEQKKSSLMGNVLKEAVNIYSHYDDNYTFMEDPFETTDPNDVPQMVVNGKKYYHYPYEFRHISTMKEDRKHNTIKLFCYTWWTLRLTDEQYDFVLNYILTHCPNIKRR